MTRLSPVQQTESTLHQLRSWLNREARGHQGPLLVGVGGPGGSGKSRLVSWIQEHMKGVAVLHLDDFRLPRAQRAKSGRFGSHPEGNDLVRLRKALEDVKRGIPVQQPVFDLEAGEALSERTVVPERIILADGELSAHQGVREAFDRLVLVDAHWRTQLNARLSRDMQLRHCDLEKAIQIFLESNLRDYPIFSEGIEAAADVIIYRTAGHGYRFHKQP